ncbi:MAG: GNAT family N-acetyltransferase [Azoarcus sp.]|jgi:GNAT superfamily N-acetyltransferase|nr:GNAT family N-acetyltransferase [Azoarcus sp.]
MTLSIITFNNMAGDAAQWLPKAEPVHRQLRDQLPPGTDAYRAVLEEVLQGGASLSLAVEGEAVRGVALWRIIYNTYEQRRLYIDDLVTDAAFRSRGVGHALLDWLENQAKALSCTVLALDSGVQRSGAHRFYFREGFTIPSFCFRKKLV